MSCFCIALIDAKDETIACQMDVQAVKIGQLVNWCEGVWLLDAPSFLGNK